jgi:hypothetical protein
MRILLRSAAAAVCLMASGAVISVAHASTITFVKANGSGLVATQVTSDLITGSVAGTTALAYGTDYVEFSVAPTTSTTVEVFNFSIAEYPNEHFELTCGTLSGAGTGGCGTPISSTLVADNSSDTDVLTLTGGEDYFLQLSSAKPSSSGGFSAFTLSVVATPLPGALALFSGGLGLVALTGQRKRAKRATNRAAARLAAA